MKRLMLSRQFDQGITAGCATSIRERWTIRQRSSVAKDASTCKSLGPWNVMRVLPMRVIEIEVAGEEARREQLKDPRILFAHEAELSFDRAIVRRANRSSKPQQQIYQTVWVTLRVIATGAKPRLHAPGESPSHIRRLNGTLANLPQFLGSKFLE